nr:SDR family NAD(P)-dependent oxidoreductase [Secundilactobacillus paracollinoides]
MKTIIVTGASSGVGQAAVTQFSRQGFNVFGLARHATQQPQLPNVHMIDVDLTDAEQVKSAVAQILTLTDHIDVLANIAGTAVNGAIEQVPITEAKQTFDVNVFGTLTLIQQTLPTMRRQGHGRIITVSSMVNQVVQPFFAGTLRLRQRLTFYQMIYEPKCNNLASKSACCSQAVLKRRWLAE